VIPVAILGTADFDVTQIEPGTVSLAGLEIRAAGKSNKLLAHIEDVNIDGFDDLVVQIEDQDGAFSEGTTIATITGNLYDGTAFEGCDEICIVPPSMPKKGVNSSYAGLPEEYTLLPNYPNPFNPTTMIRFGIPVEENVTVEIFNSSGQRVASLFNGKLNAGYHEVKWDASNVASGVYFYQITAGEFQDIKKMILMK
jgi:hypothetical protein